MASAAHEKKVRERNKRLGVCTVCRKAPSVSGNIKCALCGAKQVLYMTARRDERKAAGQCVDCMVPLPDGLTITRCGVCKDMTNQQTLLGRRVWR